MKYEFRIISWTTHFLLIPTICIVRERTKENTSWGISITWLNRAIEFILK